MIFTKLIIFSICVLVIILPGFKGNDAVEDELSSELLRNIPSKSVWEVYVYNNSTFSNIVQKVIKTLSSPYIIVNTAVDYKLCTKYLSYNDNFIMLLLTDNDANILPILRELLKKKLVVARSSIVVLCLKNITCKKLHDLYEELWNIKIGNVKFIGNVNGSISSYLFDPFHLNETTGLQKSYHFYLDKPINMNKQNLYVSIVESFPQSFKYYWRGTVFWTGRSIKKIHLLNQYYNATVILVFAKNNIRQCIETIESCTYATMSQGLENDMVGGKSEISLTYRHVQDTILLDFIQPFEIEAIKLITQTAATIPTYVTLARIFDSSIYLKIFIILSMTIFTLYFSIKWHTGRSLLGYLIFRVTFRLIGQHSRIKVVETGHLSAKISLKLCDFLAMVIWALFSTYVISALIYPDRYEDISDPERYLKEYPDMPLYGFASLYEFIKRSDNFKNSPVLRQVMKRYIGVDQETFFRHAYYTPYNKTMISYGELAFALEHTLSWATRGKYNIRQTDPLVCARSALMTVRGSIYHKFYERLIVSAFESGIDKHFINKAKYFLRSSKLVPKQKVLELNQFYPPFLILLIGYVLAIIAFVGEHCFYRFRNKKVQYCD